MKIELIIDSPGPNPEYNPPSRKDFVGPNADEDFADAMAKFETGGINPVRILPAGTIEQGSLAWVHCFPDAEGIAFKYDGGKVVPYRKAPGVVRAVPADDACRLKVETVIRQHAAARKISPEELRAEIDAGIERSRALQSELGAK
jgi:hypothetical protein